MTDAGHVSKLLRFAGLRLADGGLRLRLLYHDNSVSVPLAIHVLRIGEILCLKPGTDSFYG